MPFQILSTLREGTGAPAKVGDKLVVHYKGTLADGGAVFDDSRERGHAFTFALGCNKVIRGWDEALVGATKGARFTVRIPSADAYGPKGAPPRIPPNADLVFDLELLNINETLVEEGMRFRQEEEARAEVPRRAGRGAPRRGGGRRRRRAEGGEAEPQRRRRQRLRLRLVVEQRELGRAAAAEGEEAEEEGAEEGAAEGEEGEEGEEVEEEQEEAPQEPERELASPYV